MEDNNTIIVSLNDDQKPFVCQYIVGRGSIGESKNGIAHLTEHYLIDQSYDDHYFENVKVHGFTDFHSVCYYWYVDTIKEALSSVERFKNIINDREKKQASVNNFLSARKEVIREIRYQKSKTKRVKKFIGTLEDPEEPLLMPIGRKRDIRFITFEDIMDYLDEIYSPSNTHFFIYDRQNEIWCLRDKRLEPLKTSIAKNLRIPHMKSPNGISEYLGIQRFLIGLEEGTIRVVFQDVFSHTLLEEIIGEIFSMQICAYMEKKYDCSVHYEKIFFKKDKVDFVFCIKDKAGRFYENVFHHDICWNDIQDNILSEQGFMQIKKSLIDYLHNFDLTRVSEEEIRKQLTLTSVLSFPTYYFLESQESVINLLENLTYMEYQEYIEIQMSLIHQYGIKFIY